MKYTCSLFVAVLTVVLLTACGQQATPVPTPVQVEITIRAETEPLAVGETALLVTLTNGSGSPINGAALQVHGDMDHAGMTAVDRETSASTDGVYRVPFEWTMGGGWIVTVTAQLPNNGGKVTETAEFFVEAVSNQSIINQPPAMEMTAEATADHAASAAVNITYEPDKNPAQAGDATITIILTQPDGTPITDAAVEVVGDMAHAGMMPVTGTGEHAENGRYLVPLRWTMAGDWQVTAKVTLPDGQQSEQTFDQKVVMP